MPPARQLWLGPPVARAQFLGDREAHARRNLLGAAEIFVRGIFQRAALERHQTLVAAHIGTLVDGHGEMALAEQLAGVGLAGGNRLGDAAFVEARARAHLAGRGEVHHQHTHGAVSLRLQDEAAIDLERGTEHDREHDRLAHQLGDRLRIIVPLQDLVDHRAEPHHAAAQIELGDLEGGDDVVGGGGRGRAGRNGDVGIGVRIGHEALFSVHPFDCEPPPFQLSPDFFTHQRAGTRPAGPSAHAAGSRPRRTPPIADRRSPRR